MINRTGIILALALGTTVLTTGCATKKFVRTKVDDSATALNTRIDKNERATSTNSNQIDELNSVTRDHSGKISSLDNGLKQTDAKADQAMTVGQGTQSAADKAASQVSSLDRRFQDRNHYAVLSEEQVRFKFGSAALDPGYRKVLDEVAQKLKDNPDAILVMEGHTDAAGSDAYNIELGEKRLDTVTRYLVVEQSVPMHQVSKLSYGKARPVNENKTRGGRAQNRAVVMRILTPAAASAAQVSETR